MKFNRLTVPAATALITFSAALSGCMDDNTVDYTPWRLENDEYVACMTDAVNEQGNKEYIKVIPEWEPGSFVLMKWHNDRSLTHKNLIPLDNSTVNVKYDVALIDGTEIDDSYDMTTYGDSIYQTRPCKNITGFWAALRQMHVGDSVTCIIPWQSGYGSTDRGKIKPYSTLIYHIKMKSIQAFQVPQ